MSRQSHTRRSTRYTRDPITVLFSMTQRGVIAAIVIAVLCLLASDFRITVASKSWVTPLNPSTKNLMENCSATSTINHHDTNTNNNKHSKSNQTYSWYGNHWIPPPGVPIHTKEDMKAAFSQFDTLWIGDSTIRRAYSTMFALINSTKSIVSVRELDHPSIIDINRFFFKGIIDEDTCQSQREYAKQYIQPGMLDLWTSASICRKMDGHRSFDYVRIACYKDISRISQLYWEMQRYSLIILGVGVHDVLSSPECTVPQETASQLGSTESDQKQGSRTTARKRNVPVEQVLAEHGLVGASNIASALYRGQKNETKPTAVLWRTSGFDTKTRHVSRNTILRLNQLSLDFIHNNTGSTTSMASDGILALVDWGAAIRPRSFPPDRIAGDIGAHYGLEARLLMAQMTTQQVMNVLEGSTTGFH